jgi:hypothetical protein
MPYACLVPVYMATGWDASLATHTKNWSKSNIMFHHWYLNLVSATEISSVASPYVPLTPTELNLKTKQA